MIQILELFNGLKIKVTSDGKIYSLDRKTIRKNGRIDNRKGKELKPKVDRYGYESVTLTKDGLRKSYTVHRLVATAFIDNPEVKPTVNHINGNKRDNRIENLEWATHKEQKRHSIDNGLCQKNIDALQKWNKRVSIKVVFNGVRYDSINQAARENNVHERLVRKKGVML